MRTLKGQQCHLHLSLPTLCGRLKCHSITIWTTDTADLLSRPRRLQTMIPMRLVRQNLKLCTCSVGYPCYATLIALMPADFASVCSIVRVLGNVPPEPPEASAGKGAVEAGAPERSQGFARRFIRALLGTAAGFGGSSMMSVRMLGGVSPFSSISSTCDESLIMHIDSELPVRMSGCVSPFSSIPSRYHKITYHAQ